MNLALVLMLMMERLVREDNGLLPCCGAPDAPRDRGGLDPAGDGRTRKGTQTDGRESLWGLVREAQNQGAGS